MPFGLEGEQDGMPKCNDDWWEKSSQSSSILNDSADEYQPVNVETYEDESDTNGAPSLVESESLPSLSTEEEDEEVTGNNSPSMRQLSEYNLRSMFTKHFHQCTITQAGRRALRTSREGRRALRHVRFKSDRMNCDDEKNSIRLQSPDLIQLLMQNADQPRIYPIIAKDDEVVLRFDLTVNFPGRGNDKKACAREIYSSCLNQSICQFFHQNRASLGIRQVTARPPDIDEDYFLVLLVLEPVHSRSHLSPTTPPLALLESITINLHCIYGAQERVSTKLQRLQREKAYDALMSTHLPGLFLPLLNKCLAKFAKEEMIKKCGTLFNTTYGARMNEVESHVARIARSMAEMYVRNAKLRSEVQMDRDRGYVEPVSRANTNGRYEAVLAWSPEDIEKIDEEASEIQNELLERDTRQIPSGNFKPKISLSTDIAIRRDRTRSGAAQQIIKRNKTTTKKTTMKLSLRGRQVSLRRKVNEQNSEVAALMSSQSFDSESSLQLPLPDLLPDSLQLSQPSDSSQTIPLSQSSQISRLSLSSSVGPLSQRPGIFSTNEPSSSQTFSSQRSEHRHSLNREAFSSLYGIKAAQNKRERDPIPSFCGSEDRRKGKRVKAPVQIREIRGVTGERVEVNDESGREKNVNFEERRADSDNNSLEVREEIVEMEWSAAMEEDKDSNSDFIEETRFEDRPDVSFERSGFQEVQQEQHQHKQQEGGKEDKTASKKRHSVESWLHGQSSRQESQVETKKSDGEKDGCGSGSSEDAKIEEPTNPKYMVLKIPHIERRQDSDDEFDDCVCVEPTMTPSSSQQATKRPRSGSSASNPIIFSDDET